MIVTLSNDGGLRRISLPFSVSESLAMRLLQTLGYEAYVIPREAEDVVREGEVSLISLLNDSYKDGDIVFIGDYMEWVSTDETHTMLLFGGHIIATVRIVERNDDTGEFTEVIRWFGCQQFTITHKDV